MTDWDLITEYIHNAMEAVDQAHEATEELRKQATPETFDAFRIQMEELTDHLSKLQTVLKNEEAYAVDELADWLSQVFTGKRTEYRITPHMEK